MALAIGALILASGCAEIRSAKPEEAEALAALRADREQDNVLVEYQKVRKKEVEAKGANPDDLDNAAPLKEESRFKELWEKRKKEVYDGDLIALVEGVVRGRTSQDWTLDHLHTSAGTGAVAALKGLSRVAGVQASADGLTIRVTLRPGKGESVEDAITEVLGALMKSGAAIGTIVRGQKLEEKFLELT